MGLARSPPTSALTHCWLASALPTLLCREKQRPIAVLSHTVGWPLLSLQQEEEAAQDTAATRGGGCSLSQCLHRQDFSQQLVAGLATLSPVAGTPFARRRRGPPPPHFEGRPPASPVARSVSVQAVGGPGLSRNYHTRRSLPLLAGPAGRPASQPSRRGGTNQPATPAAGPLSRAPPVSTRSLGGRGCFRSPKELW